MQRDEPEVRVEMSFLEIYIENVYDLLAAADAVRLGVLFMFLVVLIRHFVA